MTVFHWPERVTVREVGLRDGLQSIARTLPTAQKVQWIQGAYDAGIREIEVGSFVPPKLLPPPLPPPQSGSAARLRLPSATPFAGAGGHSPPRASERCG